MSWNEKLSSYQEPGGGGYFKPQQGDNKIRIMSDPLIGYMYFTSETNTSGAKPFRFRGELPNDAPLPGTNQQGQVNEPKPFFAMVVWNYALSKIQIYEITQKNIRKAIMGYQANPKYGEPTGYDFNINRKGEGLKTEYTVIADPPEAISQEIKKAYQEANINLEALMTNGNPFGESKSQAQSQEDFDETSTDSQPDTRNVPDPVDPDMVPNEDLPAGWSK